MTVNKLALKVDVDTYVGTREGVPRLSEILKSRGAAASFYLSLGPDNSGKAIRRVFTRPGFLAKQLRNRAPGAYGFKTMLMGTLLPAPIIGRGCEQLVRDLIGAGHEVGLHAWDHVTWHDQLWKMNDDEIRAETDRGIKAFEEIAGYKPEGFAAPAWRINGAAALALDEQGVKYMSATRGLFPYRPLFSGSPSNLVEIPTTLPTADEVLGRQGIKVDNLDQYFLNQLEEPGLHVFTIHAELEGRGLSGVFERFLDGCLERGVEIVRLMDVYQDLISQGIKLPQAEVDRIELPGRPGKVSHQV